MHFCSVCHDTTNICKGFVRVSFIYNGLMASCFFVFFWGQTCVQYDAHFRWFISQALKMLDTQRSSVTQKKTFFRELPSQCPESLKMHCVVKDNLP